MSHLAGIGFKAAIIHMFKDLKKKPVKEAKVV